MSEKPVHPRPRRLVDWINPAGAKKAHSLIDKVYKWKDLEMAWERVKANLPPITSYTFMRTTMLWISETNVDISDTSSSRRTRISPARAFSCQ